MKENKTSERSWLAAAAASAGLIAALIAGCGGGAGSQAPIRVHVHGSMSNGPDNGNCASGGAQVKITSVSGKVLATPFLAETSVPKKVSAAGTSMTLPVYPFSATVPAEPKYGITAGSLPVYYVTERQFEKGLDLSC